MEVDPVDRLAIAVADEDPLTRPGVYLAEVHFVVDEATGPDIPHNGQIGLFAERPVVRRTIPDRNVR